MTGGFDLQTLGSRLIMPRNSPGSLPTGGCSSRLQRRIHGPIILEDSREYSSIE